jgi:hypothetical protein
LPGGKVGTSVKIDFVVPGFSKCGTTTLCALLDQHPGIFIPEIKEPWYFSREDIETQHEYYDEHYAPALAGQLKGDGSVEYSGYLSETLASRRIHENNPDCRVIFIARDPRARIESSYREMHHSGVNFGLNTPFALGDCLKLFPQMTKDTRFWERIQAYRNVFGDESILVTFLEDLRTNREGVMKRCFEHLGLDPVEAGSDVAVQLNVGERKLYDTRLFRYMRKNRFTGPPISRLNGDQQDRLFGPLGLRRAFRGKPPEWDSYSEEVFRREIVPDSLAFLAHYGKPPDFWGLERFQQL